MSTLVGEENETLFIRVWKPVPRRRILKTLRGNPKGKSSKRTISASGRLGLLQFKKKTFSFGDTKIMIETVDPKLGKD